MKFRKAVDVVKDWVESGYWFGYGFSNMIAQKMEVAPVPTRWGGMAFDTVAGTGLGYMAVSSGISNVAAAVTAVTAIGSAPLTAIGTVAVSTVFAGLACMTGGIGLGLLRAGYEKTGLATPLDVMKSARKAVSRGVDTVKNTFKPGKRPTPDFKAAAQAPKKGIKVEIAPKAKPSGPAPK